MKFGSAYPLKRARIEIIPLIDVMFFLLAAFILLSLSLIQLRLLRVHLPTATKASASQKPEIINVNVDRVGDIQVDSLRKTLPDFRILLEKSFAANSNVMVAIDGDRMARHEHIMNVLDTVKMAGIEKVSFNIGAEPTDTP